MLRFVLVAALVAGPALAQDSNPPKRIRSVAIQKGEACPKAAGDEVVVCRTIDEPYRIPSELRDEGAASLPTNQSWVNRAATVDQVSRVAAGLPDTCSAIGTGGQSGCFQQRAQAYAAEKRANAGSDGSGSQPK